MLLRGLSPDLINIVAADSTIKSIVKQRYLFAIFAGRFWLFNAEKQTCSITNAQIKDEVPPNGFAEDLMTILLHGLVDDNVLFEFYYLNVLIFLAKLFKLSSVKIEVHFKNHEN